MKKLLKIMAVSTMVITLSATGVVAFADAKEAPATKDTASLSELKSERLEMKKDRLADQVKAGIITQEKADAVIKELEANQTSCDGSGAAKIGQKNGVRLGNGENGMQGCSNGNRGNGLGNGSSCGNCLGN